jgi:hypothetical protein
MSTQAAVAGLVTRTGAQLKRSPRLWQSVRGPALFTPPSTYVTLEGLVGNDRGDGVPCLRQLYVLAPSQMNQLARSYLETQRTLPDEDREFVEAAIRQLVTAAGLFLPTDGSPADENAGTAVNLLVSERVKEIATTVSAQGETLARRRYAWELLSGIVATVVLLIVLALAARPVLTFFTGHATDDQISEVGQVLVCIAGGAAGAVVSVLLRLSGSGSMSVRPLGPGAGAYRVILGWFFAAAAVFLVKGGILTIFKIPDAGAGAWFFWGGVGFISGFNERWAKNLFTREPAAPGDVRASAQHPSR